jgi:VIT1/CCC1 family predicted Fe2+/Mn2+ transporter
MKLIPSRSSGRPFHRREAHTSSVSAKLNWLRAGVLGAYDGIMSSAGLVSGVAAANSSSTASATAGVAGLVAGAVSMALGEYVSVSTQRDTEQALVALERQELDQMPEAELNELIGLLQARGLSHETSVAAARELSEDNALRAHLSVELGINEEEFANPWAAALSSALSFTLGSLLPLVAILLPPSSMRIPVVFVAVLFALALTGAVSASLGQAPKLPAVARLVLGGAAAMAVTFAIGQLLDATAV